MLVRTYSIFHFEPKHSGILFRPHACTMHASFDSRIDVTRRSQNSWPFLRETQEKKKQKKQGKRLLIYWERLLCPGETPPYILGNACFVLEGVDRVPSSAVTPSKIRRWLPFELWTTFVRNAYTVRLFDLFLVFGRNMHPCFEYCCRCYDIIEHSPPLACDRFEKKSRKGPNMKHLNHLNIRKTKNKN